MKKYLGLILSLTVFASLFFVTGCSANDVAPFIDKLTGSVGGWVSFSGIITGVIEVVVRLWPTANPTSLFLVASSILKSTANLFETVSSFLDGLIQNASRDIVVKK
jgi:hypothetical protein